MQYGMPLLDFTVHPGYFSDASELVCTTANDFREKFQMKPLYFDFADNKEKLSVISGAGAEYQRSISDALSYGIVFSQLTCNRY